MVSGGSVPLFVPKLHQSVREVCFATLKRYRQEVLECNTSFFFVLAFSQCKNSEVPRPRACLQWERPATPQYLDFKLLTIVTFPIFSYIISKNQTWFMLKRRAFRCCFFCFCFCFLNESKLSRTSTLLPGVIFEKCPISCFWSPFILFSVLRFCSAYQVVVEEERPRRARGTAEILRCYPVPIHFQNATLLNSQYYFTAQFPATGIHSPQPFTVGDNKTYNGYWNAPLLPQKSYSIYYQAVSSANGVGVSDLLFNSYVGCDS